MGTGSHTEISTEVVKVNTDGFFFFIGVVEISEGFGGKCIRF